MYTQESQHLYADLTQKFLNTPSEVKDLEQLREILIYHEYKYYVEDSPIISDHEYDVLYKQLESIEQKYPELITFDSPTQRVSSDLSGEFVSVQHIVPMLSLGNSYNEADLDSFDTSIKKLCGIPHDRDIEYAVEPKFDGGSIALVYEGDLLVRAATRGNGTMGEEITPNAKSMPSIPLKAAFSRYGIVKAELRGEALIRKDNFERINRERENVGLQIFANPRNAATGGLRTKDPMETRKRGLEAFVYHLAYAVDKDGDSVLPDLQSHFAGIELLGSLGFKIPDEEKGICKNIREVHAFVRMWEEKRDAYPYEIDGMVIKVNNLEMQEKCGFTAHHPRWAIAFKFKAKQATSKLVAVEFQVGRFGTITPVAKIEPVLLAGVTVSSISLHNEDFIKNKDIWLGDTVLVERAGDVIPYIVKSFPELRKGSETPIVFPELCPVNNTPTPVRLEQDDGGAAWRCPKCICNLVDLQKMIFHVSKEAMDIDGFGKSIVERFYDLKLIRDISDIYNLDYDTISQLEGFGQKSVENLKAAIEKAKMNPIHRLLHSLSIHHLGKKASRLISEQIDHILDLKSWNTDRYLEIKDIGPVIAENATLWFNDENNLSMLQRMEYYGVNLRQTDEDKPLIPNEGGIFSGKTILFTGTLQHMGRKEAEEKAARAGAQNVTGVSSKLNFLVVGEKAGSKLKKAQDLGTVQILSEEVFMQMIGEG